MANPFHRAAGSARIARRVIGQTQVPYWPEVRTNMVRDQRLKAIVRWAAASVPYYQRLFPELGIDPASIHSAEDLDRLPLLDKAQVRSSPQDFMGPAPNADRTLALRTSGSTGVPLTVHHDLNSLLDNVAYTERERQVIRQALGGKTRVRTMSLGYHGSTGDEVRAYLHQHALIPLMTIRAKSSPDEAIEQVFEAIDRFGPDVISGNGSFLELAFRQLKAYGLRIRLPKVLIYLGQAMTLPGRQWIEREYGIPIYSRYNAVEAFKIGYTCEARQGFHLHADLTHVKIVDADGQRLSPGERGEVIITNLVNRGTVLLNYRLGDLASFSSERCRCGRNQPLLTELEGRIEEVLRRPDGNFVFPRSVWGIFKGEPDALQYQLVQLTADRCEIRLKTTNPSAFQAMLPRVLPKLRQLLGPEVALEASYHESLEGLEPGKFRTIVSYLNVNESATDLDGANRPPTGSLSGQLETPLQP